jgi:hypothetical protein
LKSQSEFYFLNYACLSFQLQSEANNGKDPRGGCNIRLSDAIKFMAVEICLRRHDRAIPTDGPILASIIVQLEKLHPELAVEPQYRKAQPSANVISALICEFALTIQRTCLKKRSLLRPTFDQEAQCARDALNRWPADAIHVLDEMHVNPHAASHYGIAPAGAGGASAEGNERDANSITTIFNVSPIP